MHEWSKQAALERSLALQISVPPNVPPSRPLPFRSSEHQSSPSKKIGWRISNTFSSLSPSDVQAAQHQAKGRLFFINTFASPLFGLVCSYIPEMRIFSDRCIKNKALWEQRLHELDEYADSSKSSAAHDTSSTRGPRIPPPTHPVHNPLTSSAVPHHHPHKPTALASLLTYPMIPLVIAWVGMDHQRTRKGQSGTT